MQSDEHSHMGQSLQIHGLAMGAGHRLLEKKCNTNNGVDAALIGGAAAPVTAAFVDAMHAAAARPAPAGPLCWPPPAARYLNLQVVPHVPGQAHRAFDRCPERRLQ